MVFSSGGVCAESLTHIDRPFMTVWQLSNARLRKGQRNSLYDVSSWLGFTNVPRKIVANVVLERSIHGLPCDCDSSVNDRFHRLL